MPEKIETLLDCHKKSIREGLYRYGDRLVVVSTDGKDWYFESAGIGERGLKMNDQASSLMLPIEDLEHYISNLRFELSFAESVKARFAQTSPKRTPRGIPEPIQDREEADQIESCNLLPYGTDPDD